MPRLSKPLLAVALAVVAAAVVVPIVVLTRNGGSDLAITVSGRPVRVRAGTTVGELRLHPRAGDLLDVHGAVLRPGAVRGAILVDGRPAPPSRRLAAGDQVVARAGTSRREPVERKVIAVPQGVPDDPQFFLARRPGRRIVVRGAVSHEIVSTRFEPTGPATVERAVALTFDDGPSPGYTHRIVATLERLHVKATFFVIGYLADEYPSLVRLERKAGMTVGNHSYNHPEVPSFDRLPNRLLDDEIGLGAASLERAGVRPTLFRPPGGGEAPDVVAAAEQAGERVVLWSVDPTDWRPGVEPAQIVRAVLTHVRAGSIVDLHDGGGDRSATLAALPRIVRGIRRMGLHLVAVPPR